MTGSTIPGRGSIARAVPYVVRLAEHADQRGDRPAITYCGCDGDVKELSWRDLDRLSNIGARRLARAGVNDGDLVALDLSNDPSHFVAAYATWKLGATVLPLNAGAPAAERERILGLGRPPVVITSRTEGSEGDISIAALLENDGDDRPLPLRIPQRTKAIASGGSTGAPKLIVERRPLMKEPEPTEFGSTSPTVWSMLGLRPNEVQLIAGPLYHNAAFSWSHTGLFEGQHLVLMDRFEAGRALRLIDRFRVTYAFFVPTALLRMLRDEGFGRAELRGLSICHSAAVCPPWLKEAWIERLGARHVYEVLGTTEGIGVALIRGEEWLAHRGSVGRGFMTEIRVRDEDGEDVPPGTIGEISMRWSDGSPPASEYLGEEELCVSPDGFASVGDLGYLDDDGYLYISDRRVDLIISGGSNVYPAEVETVLLQHTSVGDAVVVGLPDCEWGNRVHAVIEPVQTARAVDLDELRCLCLEQLANYKVPKSWQIVERLPRDGVGKVRRSLVGEIARRAVRA